MAEADIAVIGGSGLYRLAAESDAPARVIPTPYGPATVALLELAGRRVGFLPRHGVDHSVAPQQIPARANIWALASLGVRAVVSTAAVGGLRPEYGPGTLVLPDQLVDRTSGRADSYFDEGPVQHLPAADPFDPALHRIAIDALHGAGETFRPAGTVVVISGPRFSTRAESHWYAAMGGDVVNMTLSPEIVLAAELGIGTATVAFVTDTDAGVAADAAGDPDRADQERVFARLATAQPRILAAVEAIVRGIPDDYRGPQLIAPDAVAAVLARSAR